MYQAAIVEDNPEILSYIRDTLITSFEKKNISLTFDCFLNGNDFLKMLNEHYHFDMIFLDIEMPSIDGITLCKEIRKIKPDALVVFISNKEELVFQTFEVQPFRFIRKSEFNVLLDGLTSSIIEKLNEAHNTKLQIVETHSGDIYSFELNNILYIEAQRKNCRIVTRTGEKIIYCKLMDIEKMLESFIKPHRSYLVNPYNISYIGKSSILLTDNQEVPISRGKLDEVKQLFLAYTTR